MHPSEVQAVFCSCVSGIVLCTSRRSLCLTLSGACIAAATEAEITPARPHAAAIPCPTVDAKRCVLSAARL